MHSSFFYALWAGATCISAVLLGTRAAPAGGTPWARAVALLACFAVPITVALPSAVTFMAYFMEKVGLAGAPPGLLGLAIADVAVGAVAGVAMVLSLGTLTPYLAAGLGGRRGRRLVAVLLAASLGVAGWASTAYRQPYSWDHPKRLLVQHVHKQGPGGWPASCCCQSPSAWLMCLLLSACAKIPFELYDRSTAAPGLHCVVLQMVLCRRAS